MGVASSGFHFVSTLIGEPIRPLQLRLTTSCISVRLADDSMRGKIGYSQPIRFRLSALFLGS